MKRKPEAGYKRNSIFGKTVRSTKKANLTNRGGIRLWIMIDCGYCLTK